MIHGTTKPTSINTFSSHGCIRVMPEHMDDLFRSVTISMTGEIIYQPVKVAVTGEGECFSRSTMMSTTGLAMSGLKSKNSAQAPCRRHGSWSRVMQVISDSRGIAEEINIAVGKVRRDTSPPTGRSAFNYGFRPLLLVGKRSLGTCPLPSALTIIRRAHLSKSCSQ